MRKFKLTAEQLEGERYLQLVCEYFKVPLEAVIGKSRKKELVIARRFGAYIIRKYTYLSQDSTAEIIGYVNHTSVWRDEKDIPQLIKFNPGLRRETNVLLEMAAQLRKRIEKAADGILLEDAVFDFYSEVAFEQTAIGFTFIETQKEVA
ncbi:MAG TPA: helix-turn-helix domain-containing protein [Bacteroidales bacterium]|nr:helix-turn-helix domain-containing protein [Bacteroidales bacterium]